MYVVVSQWEPLPGQEERFRQAGLATGGRLRQQPGVEMMHVFQDGNRVVAIVGYTDQATYDRLVNDPNGVFAKEHDANRVEEYGRWLGSQRGETIDETEFGRQSERRAA